MPSSFSNIEEALINFNQVDLEHSPLLLNRVDFKFVLTFKEATQLLKNLVNEYDLVSKEGHLFRYYETAYFDTNHRVAFYTHHQGKLPRYKIRTRTYLDTKDHFLEIKYKNNKGRTDKFRLNLTVTEHLFDQPGVIEFLNKHNIDNFDKLKETLLVKYKRICLQHKEIKERITIDFELLFSNEFKKVMITDFIFFEVKQANELKSPVMVALKELKKYPLSLSKYCYGITTLDQSIKHNNFNPLLKFLNKLNTHL